MKHLIVILVLASATGCGGSNSTSKSTSVPTSPPGSPEAGKTASMTPKSFSTPRSETPDAVANDPPEIGMWYNNQSTTGKPQGTQESKAKQRAAMNSYVEEEIKRIEKAVADSQATDDHMSTLASLYQARGTNQERQGAKLDARKSFDESNKILKRLIDAGSNPDKNALTLGGNYCNLGISYRPDDQHATLDFLSQAVTTLKPAIDSKRLVTRTFAWKFLRNAYSAKATTLNLLSRYRDALVAYDEVMSVHKRATDLPDKLLQFDHSQRNVSEAMTKGHAAATSQAEQWVQKISSTDDIVYAAACVFSLSTAEVKKDQGLTSLEREELAKQYSSRSVELLRRVLSSKSEVMILDGNIDPIRGEPAVKGLVRGIVNNLIREVDFEQRGDLRYRGQRYEEALEDYLRLCRRDARAIWLLAGCKDRSHRDIEKALDLSSEIVILSGNELYGQLKTTSLRFTHHACLLLLKGNMDEYRILCEQQLEANTGEIARIFSLSPTPVIDPEQVVNLAEERLSNEGPPAPWTLHILGLALHRAGRDKEAIGRFQESMKLPWGSSHVVNLLGMSLALHHTGDEDQAKKWYDRAVTDMEEDILNAHPTERLEAVVLLREVQQLLGIESITFN